MNVLLTGATGYLGSRLALRLLREDVKLRLLVRNPAALLPELAARSEVVAGSLEDSEAVRHATRGVDTIFHTAALVSTWQRDRSAFDRTNVDGLRRLLDAGPSRFLYTSTFMVLDSQQPPLGDYHRTKLLAHAIAMASPAIILYPGVLFGPGPAREANFVGKMMADYREGRTPGILEGGRPRWCFAFLDDVVEGQVLAWKRAQPGARYVLGGENLTLGEFYDALAAETGIRRHLRSLPAWAARAAGHVEMLRARLTGRPPRVTPEVVGLLARDWVLSSEPAERELGYRITPFREALRRTLEAESKGAAV